MCEKLQHNPICPIKSDGCYSTNITSVYFYWINSLFTKRERWLIIFALKSHRVTESQTPKGPQYKGGWNFLCLISIHLPTRFARREIIFWWYLNRYYSMIFIQYYYQCSILRGKRNCNKTILSNWKDCLSLLLSLESNWYSYSL